MLLRIARLMSYLLVMALGAGLALSLSAYSTPATQGIAHLQTAARPPIRLASPVAMVESQRPSELFPFVAAGLAVTPLDPSRGPLPCTVRDVENVTLTAFSGPSDRDHFCLLRFPDTATLTDVLLRHASQQGERLTRRGPLLLVYLGYSPDVAYRYETVFMTIP